MARPKKANLYGQHWKDLALYMDDPNTPKPLVLDVTSYKEAKAIQLEFSCFRTAARNEMREGTLTWDPALLNAIANLDRVTTKLREGSIEFHTQGSEPAARAINSAFARANFDPATVLEL